MRRGEPTTAAPASEPNHAAYTRLVAEAERVGWPIAFRDDLTVSDYNRLHGTNGNSIPQRFGWNLQPSRTALAAAGDLEDFERLAAHTTIYGSTGEGHYYRDDGTTLRQCTLDELLAWLAKHLDPTPYAAAVAAAAEARWQATPPQGDQDAARLRAYHDADQRWREAKDRHDRVVAITEHYRDYRPH